MDSAVTMLEIEDTKDIFRNKTEVYSYVVIGIILFCLYGCEY